MSGDFGLWDVFVSMFWFMLLVVWIWMIIAIFGDIFRDHELSGVAKALWTFFIIIIPWLGALVHPGGHARLHAPGRGAALAVDEHGPVRHSLDQRELRGAEPGAVRERVAGGRGGRRRLRPELVRPAGMGARLSRGAADPVGSDAVATED